MKYITVTSHSSMAVLVSHVTLVEPPVSPILMPAWYSPRLYPERTPQCWSSFYRDPGILLQVSVCCMSVYLKLTDCLSPPSMRSLELLSYSLSFIGHLCMAWLCHSPGLLQN